MSLIQDQQLDPAAAVENGRQLLHHCPAHFSTVGVALDFWQSMSPAVDWVWENLHGRFYIRQTFNENFIGFEDPGEAVYFAMIKQQFESQSDL